MSDQPHRSLNFDPDLSALIGKLNRVARTAATGPAGRGAEEEAAVPALPEPASPPGELVSLLEEMVRRDAPDLFLVAGSLPTIRVAGALERLGGEPLTGAQIRELVGPILSRRSRAALAAERFTDLAFDVPGVGRFRANIHHERGQLAASLRALPPSVPDLGSLGLPAPVGGFAELHGGLVLVVGPAGSGKTTTLAALLGRVLASRSVHAITIEEPVEYLHANRRSLVEQVEVPGDCPSFAEALRSALRQSPDVLLVGEMRDGATMATALTAAETGHLVLGSVHAHTAAQAVHRVLDCFPAAQQEQIRRQLAITLAGIVAQRLLPRARGGGRVVAAEVMVATDAVKNLIREGRIHQLGQTFVGRRGDGSRTLEASLADLVERQLITRELAEAVAFHPEELRQLL